MDVKKSHRDVVMNYTYEIVLNDPDGIVIIENSIVIIEDGKKTIPDKWLLNTITNYSHVWKGNPSFLRTRKWVTRNHPEFFL
jgi:hypothetical protein